MDQALLEHPEHLDHPEIRDLVVLPVHRVLLDVRVCLERVDPLERLVLKVQQDLRVHRVSLVLMDHQDRVVHPAVRVLRDSPGMLARLDRLDKVEHREPMESRELLGRLDHRATLEHLELRDSQALRVSKAELDHLVHRGPPGRQDLKDQRVLTDLQEHLGLLVVRVLQDLLGQTESRVQLEQQARRVQRAPQG